MARIVVKNKNGKYKLFCNTVDMWASKLLSKKDMVKFMLELNEFKNRKECVLEMILFACEDDHEYYSYKECDKTHKRILRGNKRHEKKMQL